MRALLDRVRQEGLFASLAILLRWRLWMAWRERAHRARCRRRETRLAARPEREWRPLEAQLGWFSSAFPLDAAAQEGVAERLRGERPREVAACLERCEAILAGDHSWHVEGLGEAGRPPLWDSLIDRKGRWPSGPSEEIDYTSDARPGDIRRIWEFNRHQHWMVLGRGWRLSRDRRYSKAFAEELDSWLDANPFGRGPNWTQAQEIALRAVSWGWAWHLFHDAPEFDGPLRARFLTALGRHLRAVETEICAFGRHTHNHLVSELAGLHLTARWFPFLPDAARLEGWSRRLLVREVAKQVYEDGLAGELSTNYMLFVLDSLVGVLAADPAGWRGTPTQALVAKMGEAAGRLTRPDGSLPFVGDNDSGRGWLLAEDLVDRRAGAQLPWILEGRPVAPWAGGDPAPEWLWLFGPQLAPVPVGTRSQARFFEDGGLWTWRSDEGPRASWLLLRGGAVRRRPGVLQSHHHADVLSFELVWRGRPIVVDPGTYAYSLENERRAGFRSGRAHAGLWVADRECCDFRGRRFGVWDLPESEVLEKGEEGRSPRMGCSWRDVRHERRLVAERDGSVLVEDEIVRPPELEAGLGFPLAPGLSAEPRERGWFLPEANLSLRVECVEPGSPTFAVEEAWVSLRYAQRSPALRLRLGLPAGAARCRLTVRFLEGDRA